MRVRLIIEYDADEYETAYEARVAETAAWRNGDVDLQDLITLGDDCRFAMSVEVEE